MEKEEEKEVEKRFGPWEDFDDCMAEMTKKYPEENARRVCGALKRDLEKDMVTENSEMNDEDKILKIRER